MTDVAKQWRVPPEAALHLGGVDPRDTSGAPGDKARTQQDLPGLQARLAGLQDRLYAEHRRSLLVVLQALDAGGKDGTIRHVFNGVNPQGTQVHSFKAPAGEELLHDFLWRVHRVAPESGMIGIFNRSHYEDVLAVRVRRLVPEKVWRPRFELINGFESQLAQGGTTVIKLFLHISRTEQRKRLEARLRDPDKRWKFALSDLEDRARWDEYQVAYEEAIARTSTRHAPWFVIPADHKWYRNWAVSQILIATLEAMDPRYPEPAEALPTSLPS